MEQPVVSVIMGVYNCEDEQMLGRAVDSVLEQTFADFEFIICDDGSTDNTYAVLEKLAARDDRIVLIRNEKNMSLALTLNKCIGMAKGRYIARQDADDYSLPERFARQVAFLDDNKDIAMVGSSCLLYDKNGINGRWDMPLSPAKKDFLFNSPFVHGTLMFRREVFDKAGLYRPKGKYRKYEDYDLFMRVYEKGMKGANMGEALYVFSHDDDTRSVPFGMRMDELSVRYEGFKRLGLFPKAFIYLIKPLVLAFIPGRLINRMKRKRK